MSQREDYMRKEITKKEDGRYLIYYYFEDGDNKKENAEKGNNSCPK